MRVPLYTVIATLLFTPLLLAVPEEKLAPEQREKAGVPRGKVEPMPTWESKIFAGTKRDWWVYVPAQYDAAKPASLLVLQDGHDYVGPKGNWRTPTVLDNLIAEGALPPIIAVFINPGHDFSKGEPKSKWNSNNRSLEYDALGGRYAKFLIEEIIPELEKRWKISADPAQRAIGGASSGGICAFTVAWERPDQFGKVLSTIGSFVHLRGGYDYAAAIRKTERKPIRVWQQDGKNDLDNPFGHWPTANQQIHAALRYMGYDTKLTFTDGQHNSEDAGPLLAEALRWLWRKETPKPEIVTKGDLGGDMTLHRLLVENESWQPVAEGLGFADGPTSTAQGGFVFSDMKAPAIFHIAANGQKTKLADEPASGLEYGPDGRLYACQGSKKRIIAIAQDGQIEVIAENVQPNDMAIHRSGWLFFTDTGKQQVVRVDLKTKAVTIADTGITGPNGIALSPDGGTLAVSDYRGGNVWTFRVGPDGALDAKAPYMTLRRPVDEAGEFKFNTDPPRKPASGGDGMTTDAEGRYYVTSTEGVQVFDPTGRLCGVIPHPQRNKPLTSCTLVGAPGNTWLHITNGDRIYRRKVQATRW